ncbi:MAG: hypothetical protein OXG52_04440, partial [bacterium]|nr:hypothetical protein [bacterium]
MSFGQATVDATRLAMREDERVIVLGEDISWGGNFGQFRGLLDEFGPDRIIDMPISEALIMSAAVGAAMTGLRPVASMSFLEFTMGAMDEIVNQAAKMRYMSGGQVSVPLVLRGADAAATLNDEHGIAAELIDLRSLWPLDFETVVASVSKTGRVVIAHEAWLTGGYGAELSARIGEELFADLKAPVVRVGAARAPIP